MLKEFKGILDKLNIPFMLFCGTALGAYRDGAFCPGDEDDIDVAIDIKYYDKLQEMKKAMSHFQIGHSWLAKDGLCPEISFIKLHEDSCHTKIDVFFLSKIDDQMCWRFYRCHNPENHTTKGLNMDYMDNLQEIEFYGETYNILDDIEGYLKDNYGENWRTPIHRKDFVWMTGNKAKTIE